MPATLDYIERGVIYGSICPDAYGIGFNTVEQLVAGVSSIPSSDIVNTDLDTIDASNVANYRTAG
jgi:ribose transport system substrate-binding protein